MSVSKDTGGNVVTYVNLDLLFNILRNNCTMEKCYCIQVTPLPDRMTNESVHDYVIENVLTMIYL